MSSTSRRLSDYLLRDDKAEIEMPSAEGHVGYPLDLIDLDDHALVQLAGLKLATASPPNVNGNGHRRHRETGSSDSGTEDQSDDDS